jgi:hypothetical protein
MRYAFAISEEKYAAMRGWNPAASQFPPIAPARALELAEGRLKKIPIPEKYGWTLESAALEPVNLFYPKEKWMYVVSFRYHMEGPTTGYWPTMDFIVTMDDELLEPSISVAEPNR